MDDDICRLIGMNYSDLCTIQTKKMGWSHEKPVRTGHTKGVGRVKMNDLLVKANARYTRALDRRRKKELLH